MFLANRCIIRVDRALNWVIPKPRFCTNPRIAASSGLLALAMLCSGAMLARDANPFDLLGPDFLKFHLALFAGCFSAGLWLRRKLRQPSETPMRSNPALEGYELAYLNGGKVLAVNTAIANLANRRLMKVEGKEKRLFALSEM